MLLDFSCETPPMLFAGRGHEVPKTPARHHPDDNDSHAQQRYLDDAGRYEISYPREWFLAESSLTPNLSDPSELFSVAFPLVYRETDCAHMPKGALDVMGPSDVFVSVQERKALGSDF